jgi:D-serine deaminase-like pyridoxal phosphate-dependent protein
LGFTARTNRRGKNVKEDHFGFWHRIPKQTRVCDRDGAPTKTFVPSLFVWATVMSRPTEDRPIVDAGLKALAFDSGPPLVCDEHGRLAVSVPPTASGSATRSA